MPQPHQSPPAGPVRRVLGAFYTPDHVVDRMVRMLTPESLAGVILEPSGGDGAFVNGLQRVGVPGDRIHVVDINPDTRPALEALGVQVTIDDFLLGNCDTVADAVIGNPPYLNKQSDYVRAHRRELNARFAGVGVNDTYALFVYKALRDHVAPGGQLVVLVSDTFLTLGIHRKLREFLTQQTMIDSVTLLPADTFPDAAVRTAILAVRNEPAPPDHVTVVTDMRDGQELVFRVPQADFGRMPGNVFAFTPTDQAALDLAVKHPPLFDLLDGGLGIQTGDNAKYLRKISVGVVSDRDREIAVADVDGVTWRAYHKTGGSRRWHGAAEHAIRWDVAAQQRYIIPATVMTGVDADGNTRAGFVIAGVSTRLAARTATPGALWESNKAFVFFPKDPDVYPVEFFIAVLNSRVYSEIANALNHTVSLQIRDIKRLPLLPFTIQEVRDLAWLGREAVAWSAAHPGVDPVPQEVRINAIVDAAAAR